MEDTLFLTLAATITVAVEASKKAGLPNKFAPLLSLMLGVLYGGVSAYLYRDAMWLFKSVLAAGTACGIYEYSKNGLGLLGAVRDKFKKA